MAKKPQKKRKDTSKLGAMTQVIRAYKTEKGFYRFESRFIPTDEVEEFLKNTSKSKTS